MKKKGTNLLVFSSSFSQFSPFYFYYKELNFHSEQLEHHHSINILPISIYLQIIPEKLNFFLTSFTQDSSFSKYLIIPPQKKELEIKLNK